ncbi:proline dehydrogenase family protein [Dyadobacter psychrophilus]|uniref:proline dehydrogenase n=1 Tax=Dyadobacter psychrophilus TaxID=651661 RepID=A0A1T5EU66_9BACT|nr:proline dehydrogenase family protein [Dyadobacter psychrophilus]SKB87492.1 L-proline dehydrogenase [Dyadobacter psychrophilus]
MEDLLKIGANALRKAALNETAKEYLLENETLFQILKKAANRYIGGDTLTEAVEKVKVASEDGFKCSLEFIGESTRSEVEALSATDEFVSICRAISHIELNSTISLDLSHIGLAISPELCLHHLDLICTEAAKAGTEVIISAEGTDRTDSVLKTYQDIAKKHQNVAITLQAYLYRTQEDIHDLMQNNGRIRLVKGAFETPNGLSLPRGKALNDAYLGYLDLLLSKDHLCSIATHDHVIQQEAKKLIELHRSDRTLYEFESLYGIRNDQLQQLKSEGFPTKHYFVYGKEWYLYLCNRIAEYPLNIFQALDDLVQ